MKNFRNSMFVVAGVLSLATFAAASQDDIMGPKQGLKTFSIDTSYQKWNNGGSVTTINAVGSYFFTDMFEVLGIFGLGELKPQGGGSLRLTTYGVGVNWYPMKAEGGMNSKNSMGGFVPYVGARYERQTASIAGASANIDTIAGALGAHYFLRSGVSITPQILLGNSKVSNGGGNNSFTQFGINLTVWFN